MSKKKVLAVNKQGKGLEFNGINNYIELPTIGTPVGDSEFSISVKVRIDNILSIGVIWCFGETNGFTPFKSIGLSISNNKIVVGFNDGTAIYSVNDFSTGTYIITVTKTVGFINSTTKLFVNGNLQAIISNFSNTAILNIDNTVNRIGRWVNSVPYFNSSNYKMYQFHNRELSQFEVTEISNGGVVTDGLIRHYDFNDSEGFILEDKSGNNQNGTLTNYTLADVTIGNTNKWTYEDETPYTGLKIKILPKLIEYDLGEGLKFNGVNNYISILFNSLFDFEYTDTFSVSCIVETKNIALGLFGSNSLFEKWSLGASTPAIILTYSTIGNIELLFRSNTSEIMYFSSNVLVSSNEIYHIVVTYSNKLVSMYINGSLISHTTFGDVTTTVKNNSNFDIGGGRYCSQQNIFDFKLFNKVLTQAEITIDYESEGQSITATAVNNLISWYPIQEQEGFLIKDKSPNNLDGLMTNYSLSDVTIGIDNKRIDKYGNPIIRL